MSNRLQLFISATPQRPQQAQERLKYRFCHCPNSLVLELSNHKFRPYYSYSLLGPIYPMTMDLSTPLPPSALSYKFCDIDARTVGVREAARQRWEELKPIIQRVYIEEDRPYPYLAQLLRDQHGFETTYACGITPLLEETQVLMIASGNASSRGRLSNGDSARTSQASSDETYCSLYLNMSHLLRRMLKTRDLNQRNCGVGGRGTRTFWMNKRESSSNNGLLLCLVSFSIFVRRFYQLIDVLL